MHVQGCIHGWSGMDSWMVMDDPCMVMDGSWMYSCMVMDVFMDGQGWISWMLMDVSWMVMDVFMYVQGCIHAWSWMVRGCIQAWSWM